MILRLILGDQLNAAHTWFAEVRPDVTYVMMEIRQETDYVRHHVQKAVAFFAAMRRFAEELRAAGHRVRYFRIGDADNRQNLPDNLSLALTELGAERWGYQLPDEWRLDGQLRAFSESCGLPVEVADTEHFLTQRADLATFFLGKKTFLMETFYRQMRRKHHLLIDAAGEPIGGQWNFDAENRKKWTGDPPLPPIFPLANDCRAEHADLLASGAETIGTIRPKRLEWPLDRTQALALLDYFLERCLPEFGRYEDAMTVHSATLFHSRLSFALNTKLLHPLEVVRAAVHRWESDPGRISLPQVEGFVRQIIGWREYMRGVYWAKMPEYAQLNYFGHERPLPRWYWDGQTRMRCLQHAVGQSLEYAYAHHIQRLMVTGAFALLAGVHPDAVDAWYLGVYIDAIEWVEITNTRGMSQFADGGIVGTKPYVGSANYILKMSDYCSGCAYDPKRRHGEGACPFNSLYWHFYDRHRDKLSRNPRIGMAYKTLDALAPAERAATLAQAEAYLERLDDL